MEKRGYEAPLGGGGGEAAETCKPSPKGKFGWFVVCGRFGLLVGAISREARNFKLGEPIYYLVLISTAVLWQLSLLGLNGVIFCGSSLLSGILSALSIPIVEVLGVVFYHEKFQPTKGISLVISLWGFVSYFYGEIRASKKASNPEPLEAELVQKPISEMETV
ncbi:hypothetical protein LIER_38106 [Lithospermum erythrorhizon]|uniref:Uncharacterized protein n=1 Tax=Lithospermum erythrorhizon TaxID=34254 RepID=A0AAV3PWX6_LITER